ncbi:MAG: tripartite tricarboxylate transporter TctB family protein [Rhodospirillaceae bacterium]
MRLRMHGILPYVIVLAICGYLFHLAVGIQYNGPPGRIGPDFWPKAILLLAIATCGYEIVRRLIVSEARSTAAQAASAEEGGAPPAAYPGLLLGGIALTVAYLLTIERVGFFLCTFLYLAGFMFIGRYRRVGVVFLTSFMGALLFMFVFMKVVYVSLPIGQEPFRQVSLLLMTLMNIR